MASDATRPLALVTGASSGIGLELARQFAQNGFDLVITAEDAGLASAAQELSAEGGQVHAVQVDLTAEGGVDELWRRAGELGRPLEAVALNAGVGAGGPFAKNDLARELQVIALNVTSTVHLAKHVVQDMVARGGGRLLITSSIAATQPGAFHAVYNASKSFVQSFALAIGEELKDTGVTVTSLMPGPTETAFFERGELEDTKVGQSSKDDPAKVAQEGFEALMAGEAKVVAGSLTTKLQGRTGRFVPDTAKAKAHRKMAEPQG